MVELGLGWTQDTVIRLVEEYKKRPELWDTSHDMYRVQTAKYEAWSELASLFECEIADLRRKMNSILASLRREKVKVRCGARSLWFLYEHLSFLPRHLPNNLNGSTQSKRRKKLLAEESEQSDNDNTNQDDEENENDGEVEAEVEVEEDEEQELVYIKQEPVTTYCKPTPKYISTQPIHKPRLTRPIRRRVVRDTCSSKLDSKILETLKLIKKSDVVKKKDECDSFGEYIADSLRKHDERTQCMIKQAINNILFEQEMKKYGSGSYELLISTVDENPLVLEDNSK